MIWKAGDWVVFERSIGQIKEVTDDGFAVFADGFFETSGRIVCRFRGLSLRNKRVVETFDTYYNRLHEIDGQSGFNYPDISRYFSQLALDAIDDELREREFYDKAMGFVQAAREYSRDIDGVRLFRRAA